MMLQKQWSKPMTDTLLQVKATVLPKEDITMPI